MHLLGARANAAPAWVKVGAVTQFKVGVPKKVTLKPGVTAFIVRQRNNRWLALSSRCTHKGGEVVWEPGKNRFLCPLHQATFGIDGKNPTGPAGAPLAVFATQVTSGAHRSTPDLVELRSKDTQGLCRETPSAQPLA